MAKGNIDNGILKVDLDNGQENSFELVGFETPENHCHGCFEIESLYAANFNLEDEKASEVATSSTSAPVYEMTPRAKSHPAGMPS